MHMMYCISHFGSTVTERVPRTTRFQEEVTKPKKPTKPAKPITKPAKPTEPDFFGDRYTMDDYLPQTVSILFKF